MTLKTAYIEPFTWKEMKLHLVKATILLGFCYLLLDLILIFFFIDSWLILP